MKNIIAVISAIFVSLLLGYAFMGVSKEPQENVTPVMSESNTIKAFQVGAFTSKETAEKEALSKSGKVITDGQYYYVYVAILSDQEYIDKIKSYGISQVTFRQMFGNKKAYEHFKYLEKQIDEQEGVLFLKDGEYHEYYFTTNNKLYPYFFGYTEDDRREWMEKYEDIEQSCN